MNRRQLPSDDQSPAGRPLEVEHPKELVQEAPDKTSIIRAEESLGDLYFDQRRPEIAVEHYEKGFLMAPGAPSIALKYHQTILSLNAFARAEPILQQACNQIPRERRLRFLSIDILLRQEKFEAAMAEIEAAMADFGLDDGMLDAALSVRSKLGPYKRANTPSVSLCMIVKDEADHLARCLRSAKPVVDDIVVVDTGSKDRSADIARAFGARVFEYAWQDDFAAARNVSISAAAGDWIFVLDADEVVSPKDYAHFREMVGRDVRALGGLFDPDPKLHLAA